VWEVKRNAQNQIIDVRHRRQWPYVKHYYFHPLLSRLVFDDSDFTTVKTG
jgi:hypothetical protein